MNLKQTIRKVLREETNFPISIRKVMGLNESNYLLRRIDIENINSAIEDGLEYASKRFIIDMDLTTFIRYVIDVAMDDLHPKLIWGREEFPYDEVYDFLVEKYGDKIKEYYQHHCGN